MSSNNLSQISNNNIPPNDSIEPDNKKISRIGLLATGFAGMTASIISHILIIGHLKKVPLRSQILPCLGIAFIGASVVALGNRSISQSTQKNSIVENTTTKQDEINTNLEETETC